MKLAISGKGGTGKSTLAAALALLMAQSGRAVLAVDADPDANLADALGISAEQQKRIVTIARQKALIERRTGAKVGQYGQMFKLNPEVSDIASRYAYSHRGVGLLVLGAVARGGAGCACPENVLLRALVTDIVLHRDEALVMDMEAGIEHLGRATARGVDLMLVVVEPGQRAIDSAFRIARMAGQVGIRNVRAVANKVTSAADEQFIRRRTGPIELVGSVPFSEGIRLADRNGVSVLDGADEAAKESFAEILRRLDDLRG